MHQVLLIDEVLELIFENFSDWDPATYQATLCCTARTCKTWKDPSLQRLWRRLEGVDPLVRLLKGSEESTENCEAFNYYAAQVKQIKFNTLSCLPADGLIRKLPNLRSATLSRDGCLTPSSWVTSPSLRELKVDLRGNVDTQEGERRRINVRDILRLSPTLESLYIKGWASIHIYTAIESLTNLRSLTLHTGQSLIAPAIASLVSLPNLQEFSVHASNVNTEWFISSLPHHHPAFAKLHTLRLRAQHSLIQALIEMIPQGQLRDIHLEIDGTNTDTTAWKPIFDALAASATDTLTRVRIDQILDPDEIESNFLLTGSDTRLTLDTLQPLSALRNLREFVVDTMLLPDLLDRDVDTMASWWSHLRHLDLGTRHGVLEESESGAKPKATLVALHSLAKRCPELRHVALPLDITPATVATSPEKPKPQVEQHTLRNLFIGCASSSASQSNAAHDDSDALELFIRDVQDVFPGVLEIECAFADRRVCHVLNRTGKADGCADGQ